MSFDNTTTRASTGNLVVHCLETFTNDLIDAWGAGKLDEIEEASSKIKIILEQVDGIVARDHRWAAEDAIRADQGQA